MSIAGKYQLERNENFVEYLTAIGFPEEQAKKVGEEKNTTEITVDGKKYTFVSDNGSKRNTLNFVLDEEYDDPMPTGHVLKSLAKLDGSKLTITSKAEGKSGSRVYEFSGSGFVLTLASDSTPIVAKRIYKKI